MHYLVYHKSSTHPHPLHSKKCIINYCCSGLCISACMSVYFKTFEKKTPRVNLICLELNLYIQFYSSRGAILIGWS